MGLQIILNIHQVEDLVFDDIAVLNDELMNQGYGTFDELYSDECARDPNWKGVFIQNGPNDLKIACRWDSDFAGYEDNTMVWGCYGPKIWDKISQHIVEGKLVFHIDIEGNPDEYVIMTPGQYEVKSAAKLTF